MNENDLDLIMALAAGEFPPEEAAEIESSLDPAARRELAAQRAAMEALGGLRQPVLSSRERQRLRNGVRAELGMAEAAEAVRPQKRRKTRLARALPALATAAALAAVVGIALSGIWQTGSEVRLAELALTTSTTQVQATPAPTPTTAMMAQEAAADAAAVEMEMDERVLAETAADSDEIAVTTTTRAAATTAAAEERSMEEAAMALEPSVPFDLSVEQILEIAGEPKRMAWFAEEYAAGAAPFPVSELGARAEQEGLVCWEGATAEGEALVLFMGAGLIDGEWGEAYVVEEEGGGIEVHLFDVVDCTNLNP